MPRNSGQVTGNLQGMILAVLERKSQHGYAVARQIELRSKEALSFGEGALYPALRSLERDGFVVSAWDTESSGPARRIYRITPEGSAELLRLQDAWRSYRRAVDRVLLGGSRPQST